MMNAMNVAAPVIPPTKTTPIGTARPKRFTVNDYHRLIETGIIPEDHRLELIRGEIFEMAAKGSPHTVCTGLLCRQLDRLVGDIVAIRSQEPITLPNDSEPEPDVVIALGQLQDYLLHHPTPDQILLIIEVADSSLSYDRTTKLSLYAEFNIPHYWIANVPAKQMECHSHPYQDSEGNFSYKSRQAIVATQELNLPDFPEVSLNLSDIFL